jgi:hypothetical protein
MIRMSTLMKFAAVTIFAAALAGCATTAVTPQTPEQQVAERALLYWRAVIANDYKATYALMTPGYRMRYTYEKHILGSQPIATFLTANVKSVTCPTEESCEAQVAVTFTNLQVERMRAGIVDDAVFPDKWVRIDGQWWRFRS